MGNYKTNPIATLNGVKLSEHNRKGLDTSYELIESKQRMIDTTLRWYSLPAKRNWSVSWESLPSHNRSEHVGTVDGGMSGTDLEAFFHANRNNAVTMVIRSGQGESETFLVKLSDFSRTVTKRGAIDLWDVSLEIEEI